MVNNFIKLRGVRRKEKSSKNNLLITFNYERNQSVGSIHTDTLYFGGSYISNKETEYALALDGSESLNTNFDIKKIYKWL